MGCGVGISSEVARCTLFSLHLPPPPPQHPKSLAPLSSPISCCCANPLWCSSHHSLSSTFNSRATRMAPFHSPKLRNFCTASALLDDSPPSKLDKVDLSLALKKRAAEITPDLKGTSVFLVGINSSIKSSLSKLLADALQYYYFDSDSLVEEVAGGKSAAKSYLETDEKGFRDSETEVLKQLSSMGRLVVCAGNGAVQCASNLALLRHGLSVWVDVPLDMVTTEVVENRLQLPASEMSISGSYSEVLTQLTALYRETERICHSRCNCFAPESSFPAGV